MSLLIKKFGGTSVGTADRIVHVARHIAKAASAGHQLVIVVSAMAGTTDQLLKLGQEVASHKVASSHIEMDAVLAAGEQITSGLLALALNGLGIKARSFLAWQLPLHSSPQPGHGVILDIEVRPLLAALAEGMIPIVAGFQGFHASSKRLITLGRGGSDTSAVALAAALNAECCDIYTDVEGVYSADPRIVPNARKLEQITFTEMLEMASLGAKVLQTRSVQLAQRHHVRLQVLSSFTDAPGTLITYDNDTRNGAMEQQTITGLAYSRHEVGVMLYGIHPQTHQISTILAAFGSANIAVDTMVQMPEKDGTLLFSFTVKEDQGKTVESLLTMQSKALGIQDFQLIHGLAKVSAIGMGIRRHTDMAQQLFLALAEKSIPVYLVSTSEIKISVLIPETMVELAMRTLHTVFELDK